MRRDAPAIRSHRFHAEGWHPMLVACLGAAVGLGIVSVVSWAVYQTVEPGTADVGGMVAAVVTGVVGGGAASLTLKNLKLKQAESRRSMNIMFDGQFQSGAELLGGATESEVIAGALLLGSLLRESPRHAQACADLMCSRLRKRHGSDLTVQEQRELGPDLPRAILLERGASIRVRNAITRAIEQALSSVDAPPHLASIRWDLSDVFLGDTASFRRCVFGSGSALRHAVVLGGVDMTGAQFNGGFDFEAVETLGEVSMRAIRATGPLSLAYSSVRAMLPGRFASVHLEGAQVEGLTIKRLDCDGHLGLDDLHAVGDLRVSASTFASVSLIDGRCERFLNFDHLHVDRFIVIRNTPVRKGVHIRDSTAGEEIEVTSVATQGVVTITDSTAARIQRDPEVDR